MKWKEIPGWEERYEASEDGQIRNMKTGRILKPVPHACGYLMIELWKDGKKTPRSVARCVLSAFVPQPEGKPHCRRKDRDQTNNCIDNLYWAERRVCNFNEGRLKPVKQIDRYTGEVIAEFESIREAWRQTGVNWTSISHVVNGLAKSAGGYRWEAL